MYVFQKMIVNQKEVNISNPRASGLQDNADCDDQNPFSSLRTSNQQKTELLTASSNDQALSINNQSQPLHPLSV